MISYKVKWKSITHKDDPNQMGQDYYNDEVDDHLRGSDTDKQKSSVTNTSAIS